MRKESQVLNDNTTMTIEYTTGRCDIKITTIVHGVLVTNGIINAVKEEHEEKAFYWIELEKSEWVVRLCVNGFCYNAVELNRTMTKKEAILTIIDRHTSKHWYDFGAQEFFLTEYEASLMAKVVSDYKQEAIEYIREYDGQHLIAYPNSYCFECDDIKEHFVKQMFEKGYFNGFYGKAVNQMSDSEPEYMGTEYMDARRLNNWNELLIEKKYGMVREHDKIYCVTSYGKVFGWFWNIKGAQQFHGLYGGDILLVDSDLFFIEQIHDKFLDIICTVETDELSIESQLIYAGYLNNIENRPSYIFACLQSYTQCFELEMMVNEKHLSQHELSIQKFLKSTYRDLANGKDYEKSLLEWCKDMEYLTERIIADYLKEGENNDNT